MKMEQKIGQMLGVGFDGLEPPGYLLDWLAEGRVGAVLLFGRNIASPAQLAALTQTLHAASKTPLLIGIDQEGGMVTRLRDGFTISPGAMALSAGGSAALAEAMSAVMAAEMRALGINWTFAPVVDIVHDIRNRSVGTRSPGMDPAQVSRIAAAQIRGFQRGGVAATAKHFPGLGKTPIDTHEALAIIDGPLDYLWTNDLIPYRAAVDAGVETIMVSHVQFPALDTTYPATLSPHIIGQLLRQEIGFQGLVCTDDMEMRAIADHYGQGEAAVLAALAGQDMILISHAQAAQEAAYAALTSAVRSGRLPLATIDAAVERIRAVKARVIHGPTPPLAVIGSAAHQDVARRAAEAGLVLVRANEAVFPLPPQAPVTLVEFTTYLESEVIEQTGQSTLAAHFREVFPQAHTLRLLPDEVEPEAIAAARQVAETAGVLVIATRNAHLLPEQREQAAVLFRLGRPTMLLCLRNPYDAALFDSADTILCTCGDSPPSLAAAVAALAGAFRPAGVLPVTMPPPDAPGRIE
jgi:beta-N-acetylhexosaminidase